MQAYNFFVAFSAFCVLNASRLRCDKVLGWNSRVLLMFRITGYSSRRSCPKCVFGLGAMHCFPGWAASY